MKNSIWLRSTVKFLSTTLWICFLAGSERFAFANVVGPDMQNFNTTPDGLDFLTVESSETLRPGYWNLGLFINQAKGTLPKFPNDQTNRPVGSYNDTLLGMDLNIAYGVTKRLSLGVSLPQILAQTVKSEDGTTQGEFLKTGTTEIRPMVKYQFVGSTKGGVAAIASTEINMIEDNPYTGLGAAPIVNFELAADREFGAFAGAVNLGYRHRTPGTQVTGAPVEPLGSQWIASVAGSYLMTSIKSRLIAELFGSEPVTSTNNRSDRMLSSAEGLIGIKHMTTDALALHAGLSRELTHGIASPDLRMYLGFNYSFGPGVEHQQKDAVTRVRKKTKEKPQVDDYTSEASDDLIVSDSIPEMGIPQSGDETIVLNNVLFAFDRSDLVVPGGKDILRKLAVYLSKSPEFKHVSIEGHTDFMGTDAYNLELSLRRAAQIKRYLVEVQHLDASRISVVGYGESRPIADNGNYQGRQLNRRVEFKINR